MSLNPASARKTTCSGTSTAGGLRGPRSPPTGLATARSCFWPKRLRKRCARLWKRPRRHRQAVRSGKFGDLYASFMDADRAEQLGSQPVSQMLAAARAVSSIPELLETLGRLERLGIGGLYQFFVEPDPGNPQRYVVFFEQAAISLPDESYYREERFAGVRDAFVGHVQRMFELAGLPDADQAAKRVFALASAGVVIVAAIVALAPVVSTLRAGEGRSGHDTSGGLLFPGGGRMLLIAHGDLKWLYPDGRTVQIASGFAGAMPDGGKLLVWKHANPPGASRFLPHGCSAPGTGPLVGAAAITAGQGSPIARPRDISRGQIVSGGRHACTASTSVS
jgi:hypothetical protein